MLTSRRTILSVVAAGAFLSPGLARADDPKRAERAIGSPDAKTTVIECFSLTCSHCAAFDRETMPDVKKELIETGKVRYVFHDFPLNALDFTAFQVSRYLPMDRYLPFVEALLSSQDRWAFARGINPTEELWKVAALAGMSRATFDQAVADKGLMTWIAEQQQADQDRWKVNSTPTFVINGQVHVGGMGYEAFRKLVPDA
jgi:protein-disulfide isomerase